MVNLNLYAFSPFHPRDVTESATPAVSFTLEVTNPSEEESVDVSFMLNLPFGYNEDTVRKGGLYSNVFFYYYYFSAKADFLPSFRKSTRSVVL